MNSQKEKFFHDHDLLKYLASTTSSVLYAMKVVSVDPPQLAPLFTSPNAWEIVGHDPDSFLEKNDYWLEFIHPDDLAKRPAMAEILLKEGRLTLEYRFQHKDGHYIWIQDECKLVKDEEGNPSLLIGSWHDITQRKKSEKIFCNLLEEYDTIFNTTRDAMFLIDVIDEKTFRFTRTNKACQILTGIRSEQIEGKTPQEFLGTEQGNQLMENYQRCLLEKKSISYEETLDLPGGKRTWYTTLSPVMSNENITRIVGSSQDISERKESEKRIKELTFYDQVTGLYNRTFFEEEMQRLDTKRQLPLGIIMADVNGLKVVNDALGHLEGDKLLKMIAVILKEACRHEDIIARWGGDEFVILLNKAEEMAAEAICHRIQVACERSPENPVKASMALGFAFKETPDQPIHLTLKKAENHMYRHKVTQAQSIRSNLLNSLQKILFEKNGEIEKHTLNVKELALKLGDLIGLSSKDQLDLRLLALLHDIGKVGIAHDILSKDGLLNPKEHHEIQKHPEIGYRITMASPDLAPLAKDILFHHEYWDGQGYPKGLKGKEIPVGSRIIAIVDAYEAMTNNRFYRKAIPSEEALQEIENCAGSQFDPDLSKAFLQLMRRKA